ncbi:hypothetical protein [uncultured Nostoc sp.]|uniref:hypothetical protein n=1 Tax=uncultured Nostoc sp. TaxID=340711 RepID=UPI0035CBC2A3
MGSDRDHYEIYYADKLWSLLPAVYRTQDTDAFDTSGPLREIVNRIGTQAAILRRSIDRMWEDQSIETCDDWLIPYIADLLATRVISSLDARGQRLDVANTIYYRRRAGTVAILEEIAADITGWDVRVVEFFRRLSRTRHSLDPEIGLPPETSDEASSLTLQITEGLVGSLTHTGIGGWADIRNVYGATKTHTAFDEYFYTADFRFGSGQVGWHNIPRLGVFLWRLYSLPVDLPKEDIEQVKTTPVLVQNSPGHYSFDPTGRNIWLFAKSSRPFGDQWVSPSEWQLPTPITKPLLQAHSDTLYATLDERGELAPNALGVFRHTNLLPVSTVTIDPEQGTFSVQPVADDNTTLQVLYHYGFSSFIGAGGFDRRIPGEKLPTLPSPEIRPVVTGGADSLLTPLGAVAPTGTITIADSLTYSAVIAVGNIQSVTLRSANKTRPLIRLPAPAPNIGEWTFTGEAGSNLVLEGLFVSGGDIVLKGKFASITITCCTFDPGSSGDAETPTTLYGKSVDGRDLIPCQLWIEAEVGQMTFDRCIMGPIRTRGKTANVETLVLSDSIVQAIGTSELGLLQITNLKDPTGLASKLRDAHDSVSEYLKGQLAASTQQLLNGYDSNHSPSPELQQALITGLNTLISGSSLYDSQRFRQVRLTATTQELIAQNPSGADLIRLNRLLLSGVYPLDLADEAIALGNGEVVLSRCTLLGPAYLHRLDASECILNDVVLVENVQLGCVRFSAWASGSVLPRPYESVEIAPQAPLFTTRVFGQSGYAQLSESADTAILSNTVGATIAGGAENGSEMGVFAREKNLIKERSLLIKYEEFMPLGLVPVIIYVT